MSSSKFDATFKKWSKLGRARKRNLAAIEGAPPASPVCRQDRKKNRASKVEWLEHVLQSDVSDKAYYNPILRQLQHCELFSGLAAAAVDRNYVTCRSFVQRVSQNTATTLTPEVRLQYNFDPNYAHFYSYLFFLSCQFNFYCHS